MNTTLIKLVSAMVLGDGALRVWRGKPPAAYNLSQIADHKDYVDWQASVLEELTAVKVRQYDAFVDDKGVSRKSRLMLETRTHPLYTLLYSRIYNNNVKSISLHDLKLFDWQSAAIWYMDDGYRLKAADNYNNGNVFLCTDSYSHSEVIMLQKVIYEKLGIPFDVSPRGVKKDGTRSYRLKARKDNANRFIDGVAPYLFPSFEYKLYSK
jgi:hypothetical protein